MSDELDRGEKKKKKKKKEMISRQAPSLVVFLTPSRPVSLWGNAPMGSGTVWTCDAGLAVGVCVSI